MTPLPSELQAPFERAFDRLLVDAYLTAIPGGQGVKEVSWLVNFQRLVDQHLDQDVRRTIKVQTLQLSTVVQSALVHGNPFQVAPEWSVEDRAQKTVEIGDLLLVAERHDGRDLSDRRAILLQTKVGEPKLGASDIYSDSSNAQAALYAEWPPFSWPATMDKPKRLPKAGPCDAAQFGLIPSWRDAASRTGFVAAAVTPQGRLATPKRELAATLARTARLDVSVDATPDGTENQWALIVEDMLERAPELGDYRHAPRLAATQASAMKASWDWIEREERPVVLVRIAFGPVGYLD